MCGIIGYVGEKEVVPLLIRGLSNLEYRGYDSAGVATISDGRIEVRRCRGKICDLKALLEGDALRGTVGVGHTRWATHGKPSEENAHPHRDCSGKLVIVHNGIIENYQELAAQLVSEGHEIRSETDTEILIHLIEKYYEGDLLAAVRAALAHVRGSYAIAVMSADEPDKMVGARNASPLVVGLSSHGNFLASDVPAILQETRRVLYLNDGEVVELTREGHRILTLSGDVVEREVKEITWDALAASKEGFPHYMLKEIYEQPRAIEETMRGRVDLVHGLVTLPDLGITDEDLLRMNRIIITACGTSWHAGLVAEYLIEELCRLPVEVEYASEMRYREFVADENTLIIAVSQSGETADTLAAARAAKEKGSTLLSICNVVGSTLTRESDAVLITQAGPEIGVASTKAFTTQLTVFYLFALYLGRLRGTISHNTAAAMLYYLRKVPGWVSEMLARDEQIKEIARKYHNCTNALYLGRGEGFPVALEGALKLKEISYIHAEGYPAAEMKHGPIALIDENMPVVVLALQGRRYEKIVSNIEEVKARGGRVIALATEWDQEIKTKVDEVIPVPDVPAHVSPIVAVVPLQLLAYHIAVMRGCPVDQPRNLAKSVTVE